MEKKYIYLIIISLIILPLLLIPLIVFLFVTLTNLIPESIAFITLDLSENITLGEFLTLYLALVSIIATASIAFFIYRLEKNHEKAMERKESTRVKRILAVLLHNGINKAIESQFDDEWRTYEFVRVSEQHTSMVASIGHLLSNKQFMNLNNILETLKDMNYRERDEDPYGARQSVKKLIKLITIPAYPLYKFHLKDLQSNHDIMTAEIIQLLNILYNEGDQISYAYGRAYNNEGQLIIESFPHDYYKVYDNTGNIVCDAIVNDDGIVNGQAKTYCDEGYLRYDGTFANGQRSGKGVEYFVNGKKAKEGEWQDNQLKNGVIYDVILKDTEEILFDEIEQIERVSDLTRLQDYAPESKVGNMKVVNGEIESQPDNVISLMNYLETEGDEKEYN